MFSFPAPTRQVRVPTVHSSQAPVNSPQRHRPSANLATSSGIQGSTCLSSFQTSAFFVVFFLQSVVFYCSTGPATLANHERG